VDQVPVPSDAYVMENDYDDSMDVWPLSDVMCH
jgi:hypothetical protein